MHKIALIGAGRIGRIHAANVAAHPDLQLAYVVDPIANSAKSAAASFGAIYSPTGTTWWKPPTARPG